MNILYHIYNDDTPQQYAKIASFLVYKLLYRVGGYSLDSHRQR